MTHNTQYLEKFIVTLLDEKKAENIEIINPKNSDIESVIFANGRSIKNISSIAEYIALSLKHDYKITTHTEGLQNSSWVLIDAGAILVNIFCDDARNIVNLEQLWQVR